MADFVLVIILLAALFSGWRLGTIRVLAHLGAIIIAYQLARVYSGRWAAGLTAQFAALNPSGSDGSLATVLSFFIDTNAVANRVVQVLLFIIIFLVVRWLIRKLADLLTGLLRGGIIGTINQVVGSLLSLALAAVVVVILNSIVLPALVRLGIGAGVAEFLAGSETVLPLLYAVPQFLWS